MSLERYTESDFLAWNFQDGEPVFEGFMYMGRPVLLIAGYKGAKTLLSLQLALSAAYAIPFLGVWPAPRPRRVVYVATEGAGSSLQSVVRRERALLGITGYNSNFTMVRTPYLYLTEPELAGQLEGVLQDTGAELLVLDPFYRVHRGDVNAAQDVQNTTAVLNALMATYGCAIWMPHHEHRARKDGYGMEYETDNEKYAGSWALGAWCEAMYGFKFNRKQQTAMLLPYVEREPRLDKAMGLTFVDEPDMLGFKPGLDALLMTRLDELAGKSIREASRNFMVPVETMRRALQGMQQDGMVVLVPGGPGKETLIGLPG